MPEVVRAFSNGASVQEVRQIQKQILSDYNDDITKHVPMNQIPRIDQVWNSVPAQPAKKT